MKSIKTRELKDDAILDIKVNKTFYLMTKAALFHSFTHTPVQMTTLKSLQTQVDFVMMIGGAYTTHLA